MTKIVSGAIATIASIEPLRMRPELRKATAQMRLAFAAASDCLAQFSDFSKVDPTEVALVIGSSQGELETTKEYYKAFAQQEIARPFLFQNSLHHSTAGFLSQTLRLLGPSFTVSDGFFSGEAALELAKTLLDSQQCRYCLVVGVDTLVPDLAVGISTLYPPGFLRGEGAGALLLSRDAAVGLRSISRTLPSAEMGTASGYFVNYYDSNAIAEIAVQYRNARDIHLPKPDGSAARIHLETSA